VALRDIKKQKRKVRAKSASSRKTDAGARPGKITFGEEKGPSSYGGSTHMSCGEDCLNGDLKSGDQPVGEIWKTFYVTGVKGTREDDESE